MMESYFSRSLVVIMLGFSEFSKEVQSLQTKLILMMGTEKWNFKSLFNLTSYLNIRDKAELLFCTITNEQVVY